MTDQLADFVPQLQRIGVTMQAYNGAFNNTTHPIDVDAQAQFMQNCGPCAPKQKKEAVDGHAAEETTLTATSSSEEWHFSNLNLISWAKEISEWLWYPQFQHYYMWSNISLHNHSSC